MAVAEVFVAECVEAVATLSTDARGGSSSCWGTNPRTFARLDAEFAFELDAAARTETAKCDLWFGPGSEIAEDALGVPWYPLASRVFLNPPYGRGIGSWVEKVLAEAPRLDVLYLLLPFRPDTKWYRSLWCSRYCVEERRGIGREKFLDPDTGLANVSAPFPSVGLVFSRIGRTLPYPLPVEGLACDR